MMIKQNRHKTCTPNLHFSVCGKTETATQHKVMATCFIRHSWNKLMWDDWCGTTAWSHGGVPSKHLNHKVGTINQCGMSLCGKTEPVDMVWINCTLNSFVTLICINCTLNLFATVLHVCCMCVHACVCVCVSTCAFVSSAKRTEWVNRVMALAQKLQLQMQKKNALSKCRQLKLHSASPLQNRVSPTMPLSPHATLATPSCSGKAVISTES